MRLAPGLLERGGSEQVSGVLMRGPVTSAGGGPKPGTWSQGDLSPMTKQQALLAG